MVLRWRVNKVNGWRVGLIVNEWIIIRNDGWVKKGREGFSVKMYNVKIKYVLNIVWM